MTTTETEGRTFGEKLSDELAGRDPKWGARTLAREMVAVRGGSLEATRRAIIRWRQGVTTPVARNRRMVEDVLGVPRDSLKGDNEDEITWEGT